MSFPVREYVMGTAAGFFTGMVGTTLVKVGASKLIASMTTMSSSHRIISSAAIGSTTAEVVSYFIDKSSPFWGGVKFGLNLSASLAYCEAGGQVAIEEIKSKPGGPATLKIERFRNITKQEICKSSFFALMYSIVSRSQDSLGIVFDPLVNFQIGKWAITKAYGKTVGVGN